MTTQAISSPVDSFSWGRCLSLWYYYKPALSPMLWLWPLLSFILFLGSLLPCLFSSFWILSAFGIGAAGWLWGFSPLMLARSHGNAVSAMLPVTPLERLVFLLGFFLLVTYVLIDGTIWACYGISLAIFGAERLATLQSYIMTSYITFPSSYGLVFFSAVLPAIATLTGVVLARRNRVLIGIAVNIGVSMTLGLIVGIFSAVYGFMTGFYDAVTDQTVRYNLDNATPLDPEIYKEPMVQAATLLAGALSLVAIAVAIWLMYRKFKKQSL